RFKGSCIRPPALKNIIGELAIHSVNIIDICYFKLPAPGGADFADNVEHIRIVHINTSYAVIGFRCRRLLLNEEDVLIMQNRHSITVRVGYLLEHDSSPFRLVDELAHRLGKRILEQVISQQYQKFLIWMDIA